jgi:hypothetical protein
MLLHNLQTNTATGKFQNHEPESYRSVRRYKFGNQALPLASFKTQGPCISQGIFLHIIPHFAVAAAAATSLPIKHCHWQVSINVSHAEMFQAGLLLALPPLWSGSHCCSPPVHAAGGAAALGLHALVHALPALCSDMNQLVLNLLLYVPLNYVIKASFASEHHAGGEPAGRAVADVARVKLWLTATNSTQLQLERRRRLPHRRRRPPPRQQTS